MPIIIIIALLTALKYFEISPFTRISWWWVIGLMVVAFIWFEFLERILGLDERRAHDKLDKAREQRVKDTFRKDRK